MSNLKYTTLPSEASHEDVLAELALDVSCVWNHRAGDIWKRLNPELWEATHNPWVVLQTVSGSKLEQINASRARHFKNSAAGIDAGAKGSKK